jgi:hypothetical protein
MKLRTILATLAVTGSILTAAPAFATSPVITGQTNSVSTVYPVVDGYVDSITFGWTLDQAVTSLQLDVMDASTHTSVFQIVFDDPATTGFVWNGRTGGDTLVPAGSYYARVSADNGTDPADSNNGPLFVLSAKKLTQQTFTKQVTASGSLEFKGAGKCSQVRTPGLKLGAGSLGYYSNVRCTTAHQDFGVSFHSVRVPASFKPGTARLSAYGVAVKAGSVMHIGFAGDAVPVKIGPTKGWHTGQNVSAAPSINSENRLEWAAVVDSGNRYDIKYFKITYPYTTLS